MIASCPQCGRQVSRYHRGHVQTQQPLTRTLRPAIWECTACHAKTTEPVRDYEDRLEWFFDQVVWRVMKWMGAAFLTYVVIATLVHLL